MEKTIVATVAGNGVVEAKNDRATFTLTVKSKSETLDAAKEQVKEKTNHFLKEMKHLNLTLDGDVSTTSYNYKLEHREGTEKFPAGFQSFNVLTWTVVVDDNLDALYQACLKVDAAAPSPGFSIKDREVLLEQAVLKASDDVKEKLNKECRLLGVSPDRLSILNWHFGYEGYIPMYSGSAVGIPGVYTNSTSNAMGFTGPQGNRGMNGVNGVVVATAMPAVMKVGSIYQELLDTPKLVPGIVAITAAVQVSYVWAE